jgi:hypothetical protein
MLLLVVAAQQQTWAQEITAVIGQGSLLLEQADLHAAAPLVVENTFASQVLIGTLLLLAGFTLHALIATRRGRSVRVHAARERQRSTPVEQLNVYWMNMRVR